MLIIQNETILIPQTYDGWKLADRWQKQLEDCNAFRNRSEDTMYITLEAQHFISVEKGVKKIMEFVKTDYNPKKKMATTKELEKLMADFMADADTEVVEMVHWEDHYKNEHSAAYAVKKIANAFYPGKVRISTANGKVFIIKE